VQFARDGAPLALLRIHQPRGKLFQFGAGLGDLVVPLAGLPFERQDFPDTE
jgi:hypothetical protein